MGDLLEELRSRLAPGWTTADVDRFAEAYIRDRGAIPSFKGYRGFPAATCTCLNHELVHGLPSDRHEIAPGDLVKIDVGACLEGWHADSSLTIAIDPVSNRDRHLVESVERALVEGIATVRDGVELQEISAAIEDSLGASGLVVPHHYIGHGIGRNLHEYPPVPNYRSEALPNPSLQSGMTIAVEPIALLEFSRIGVAADGWTVVSLDNVRSAQREHTILVTQTGCEILTSLSAH